MVNTVTITVPGTTSNVGPGFDCLGAALTLRNDFKFTPLQGEPECQIAVLGMEPGVIPGGRSQSIKLDSSNLVYQSFLKCYEYLEQSPPGVQIDMQVRVPFSRGLGSSATAIVGGLVGANALAGSPLTQDELVKLAIAIEGHPDNVVPALQGGCRLAATDAAGDWTICDVNWHPDVVPVVAIPDFEVSTEEARRILPKEYSRADAIFNMAHLGLLLRGLETGREDWIRSALQDRIHQPYRQSLITGFEAVQSAAIAAGAYGLVISGAGPTLLALTNPANASTVAIALSTAWNQQGISVQTKILQVDPQGAVVV
ncbi:homoserine kinase [Oscillatoria sp. FACHB-1407]|uniref:homoserine kinase n=1 Tax=Oscillatoria sp. FACHB-1407 TaxID=2692847 RepID=UPI0016871C0A|nr:homoserine kinase [Oscillatoria sp. FACHB-1407]MBD2462779.1 homoserine kinase [Oscillatoria sp. FACHB-1407]